MFTLGKIEIQFMLKTDFVLFKKKMIKNAKKPNIKN